MYVHTTTHVPNAYTTHVHTCTLRAHTTHACPLSCTQGHTLVDTPQPLVEPGSVPRFPTRHTWKRPQEEHDPPTDRQVGCPAPPGTRGTGSTGITVLTSSDPPPTPVVTDRSSGPQEPRLRPCLRSEWGRHRTLPSRSGGRNRPWLQEHLFFTHGQNPPRGSGRPAVRTEQPGVATRGPLGHGWSTVHGGVEGGMNSGRPAVQAEQPGVRARGPLGHGWSTVHRGVEGGMNFRGSTINGLRTSYYHHCRYCPKWSVLTSHRTPAAVGHPDPGPGGPRVLTPNPVGRYSSGDCDPPHRDPADPGDCPNPPSSRPSRPTGEWTNVFASLGYLIQYGASVVHGMFVDLDAPCRDSATPSYVGAAAARGTGSTHPTPPRPHCPNELPERCLESVLPRERRVHDLCVRVLRHLLFPTSLVSPPGRHSGLDVALGYRG